jgi:hypothetical protein
MEFDSVRSRLRAAGRMVPGAVLFLAVALEADEATSVEYALKAAFLLNFTKFVEWPSSSFPDGEAPFVIGVLGEDPFKDLLDSAMAGRTVGKRKIAVRRIKGTEEAAACHILFVALSEEKGRPEIRKALAGKAILTVAELPDFAEKEGIIQFLRQGNKIRLKVNVDNARAAGLKISSNLLRLATIARRQDGKEESGG